MVYNRSRKGWFDTTCFTDWFESIFFPSAKQLNGNVALIGDNLLRHFAPRVVQLSIEHHIRFICLPANAIHLWVLVSLHR